MTFQQTIDLDLQRADIVNFAINSANGQSIAVNPEFPNNFSSQSSRSVGTTNQNVVWTTLEDWGIYIDRNRPRFIASKEINCLSERPVAVEVIAYLGISQNLSDNDKNIIISAFNSFNEAINGDPNDYIYENIKQNPHLNRTMFHVFLGYKITAKADRKLDARERDNFLRSFGSPGSIITNPNGDRREIAQYWEENGYFPLIRGTTDLTGVATPSPDPDRIVGRNPQDVARERATKDQPECAETKTETHDVADLHHWIESRILWEEARIHLGCGNYCIFHYPVFQSREVSYHLCSALTAPDPIDDHVRRAVMDCFWRSVLAGTVVGVALWNPKAALIAFKALFLACITNKFEMAISCVNVDLFIETRVVNDWH